MPVRITFRLVSQDDMFVDRFGGKASHGVFLKLVQDMNPDLSYVLHERSEVKPFITMLQFPFFWSRQRQVIPANHPFTMSISALVPETEEILRFLAHQLSTGILSLRLHHNHIMSLPFDPNVDVWEETAYPEYVESGECDVKIVLRFLSPTMFRRINDHVLLPFPELVFGSLLRKWNAFSPFRIDLDMEEWARAIRITKYQLETKMLEFGSFRQLGFVGDVRFDIGAVPDSVLYGLNILARYSGYAGVGAKTTMGMGHCRRIGVDEQEE